MTRDIRREQALNFSNLYKEKMFFYTFLINLWYTIKVRNNSSASEGRDVKCKMLLKIMKMWTVGRQLCFCIVCLKEVGTKLEILNDEFQHVHKYNPIEHIKTRVKSPESIVKKLRRYGYEISIENMVKYVNDIAGVRLICSFTSDIYRLAEMIGNQSDIKVLSIKDYIKNPKAAAIRVTIC